MVDIESDVAEVYLLPGEVHLARRPAIIRTILGSCVGVTFWCSRLGAGALTHSLLPWCPKNMTGAMKPADGRRYVDYSIRELAREFDALGAQRDEVQVKLFGGADVLLVSDPAYSKATVGKQNCAAALEVVSSEGFTVTASSLGGKAGMNIRFDTRNGEVLLRRLN